MFMKAKTGAGFMLVVACLLLCNCLSGNKLKSPSLDSRQETSQEVSAGEGSDVKLSTTNITIQDAAGATAPIISLGFLWSLWSRWKHRKAVDRLVEAIEVHDVDSKIKRCVHNKGIDDEGIRDTIHKLIHKRKCEL